MQIRTPHRDDDVEVDLQVVRDALFDAEVVRLVSLPPAAELGEGQDEACEEEEGGDLAAAAGGQGVGRFGFRWWFHSVYRAQFRSSDEEGRVYGAEFELEKVRSLVTYGTHRMSSALR